jgi:hypothetical protein
MKHGPFQTMISPTQHHTIYQFIAEQLEEKRDSRRLPSSDRAFDKLFSLAACQSAVINHGDNLMSKAS